MPNLVLMFPCRQRIFHMNVRLRMYKCRYSNISTMRSRDFPLVLAFSRLEETEKTATQAIYVKGICSQSQKLPEPRNDFKPRYQVEFARFFEREPHCEMDGLDYQPLFEKGARTPPPKEERTPDSRKRRKLSL